jgi:hypothetical protein
MHVNGVTDEIDGLSDAVSAIVVSNTTQADPESHNRSMLSFMYQVSCIKETFLTPPALLHKREVGE